jgi:pimeloyl-ACP methyl ester carboxylesterase
MPTAGSLHCSATARGHQPSSSSLGTAARVTSSASSCAHSGNGRQHAPTTGRDSAEAIPPSQARRTLDDATGDLHALIEAADLPFVHVGASGGGYIALYYASRYRDEVAGVVLLDVAQDDPKEGAKLFPGAKAWGNPEHLDNVDAMRRVLRLSPLALEDIPLRVITAAEGPAIAEKNQSAWLKLSSDAQQTTLSGGHSLTQDNPDGVVAEIQMLLDAIDD